MIVSRRKNLNLGQVDTVVSLYEQSDNVHAGSIGCEDYAWYAIIAGVYAPSSSAPGEWLVERDRSHVSSIGDVRQCKDIAVLAGNLDLTERNRTATVSSISIKSKLYIRSEERREEGGRVKAE